MEVAAPGLQLRYKSATNIESRIGQVISHSYRALDRSRQQLCSELKSDGEAIAKKKVYLVTNCREWRLLAQKMRLIKRNKNLVIYYVFSECTQWNLAK